MVAVIMPRQGQSVESCIISKWHKQKGDKVSVGDSLFTYETDKATFEETAKVSGVVLELFFEEGDSIFGFNAEAFIYGCLNIAAFPIEGI